MWVAVIIALLFYSSKVFIESKKINPSNWYEIDKRFSQEQSLFRAWDLLPPRDPNIIEITEKISFMKFNDSNPGNYGRPVVLRNDLRMQIKLLVEKGWKDHAFNEFVSEMIALNRTLPDLRDDWCKQNRYSDLPNASVIICFHNEAWSTLLRTVHSVLSRSPSKFLAEIILVDDFSTLEHLGDRLDQYLLSFSKVKLIRNTQREGLIRSRIRGVKYSTGSVIVFLDSHCEVTKGWLEPLLHRIGKNPKIVASPVIDRILDTTFEYVPQTSHDIRLGGFTWSLKFDWISIPYEVQAKRKNPSASINTPTISGGIFAINKEFFKYLGMFDDQYDSWGSENLELSFKTWMCGGSLEIVPCSHVGHVFRKRFPYDREPGSADRNAMRLAEVWMDEYGKYYFQRLGTMKIDYGNVTHRKELRKKLKCKSFKWYLDNIYPELVIPNNLVASGTITHLDYYGWCLEALSNINFVMSGIVLNLCHNQGGNQFWTYTKHGELMRDNLCLDYKFQIVMLYMCQGIRGSQTWLHNEKTYKIKHFQTQKCLTASKQGDGYKIHLAECKKFYRQTWKMGNFNFEKLSSSLKNLTV